MFLPADFQWLEPVLIAAAIVFVVGLIGNILAFGSRFTNALVTAILFAVVFGFAVYYGYAHIFVEKQYSNFLPVGFSWFEPVLIASVIVFFVDFIGNMLSFSSRFVNAIVTAIVFAIVFGAAAYYGYADLFVKTTM